jgi:hypothetical protein
MEATMSDDIASHIEALDNIIESLQRERMRLAKKFLVISITKDEGVKIAEAVLSQHVRRRVSSQSKDWAGYSVADALCIEIASHHGLKHVSRILSDAVAMGLLSVGHYRNTKKGRDVPVYVAP